MKHSRYKYISIIVVLTIILTFKTVNSRRLLSRRSRRKASEILGISVFTVNVRLAHGWGFMNKFSGCNRGESYRGVTSSCGHCGHGRYQDKEGHYDEQCKSCPTGQYQNQNSQHGCKHCPTVSK